MGIESMPAETPEENKNKPPEVRPKENKPWADIWGENEVVIGEGGKIEITDRSTGDVTVNSDEKPSGFFHQLDRAEQDAVIAEVEKFKNSKEIIGLSAPELISAVDDKREELAKNILDAKKEGESK